MNEHDYINKLKELELRVYDIWIKVRTQINNELDARVSTFHSMAIAIRSFKIYLILKEKYLDDKQWFTNIYQSEYKQPWPVTDGIIQVTNFDQELTHDFNVLMLMSYTQILFSIVESKFRLSLMAIDPNALGKKYYFHDVYTCLLKRVEKTQYQEFIKFFSLIRNTIHNNGVYMKASKRYDSSEYRGKTYEFKHNEFVKYPDGVCPSSLLLLQITPDVIDMMEDIIMNSELININSIPEPAYSLRSRLFTIY